MVLAISQGKLDRVAIKMEIDRIRDLGIDALRQRWHAVFGGAPQDGFSKDIMARMLAYRLQEEAFGELDRHLVTQLDRLGRGKAPNNQDRHLKTGTVLVREYQGARQTVTVVPGGFVWNGNTYSSLSIIARTITGTAWNGPKFFGLRIPADNKQGGQHVRDAGKDDPRPKAAGAGGTVEARGRRRPS